jgi:hypothetical protein
MATRIPTGRLLGGVALAAALAQAGSDAERDQLRQRLQEQARQGQRATPEERRDLERREAQGQVRVPRGAPETGGGSTALDADVAHGADIALLALGGLGLAGAAGVAGTAVARRRRAATQA